MQVALELSMWIILAVVSLLTAMMYALDDVYRDDSKSEHRKYSRTATPDKDDNKVLSDADPAPTAKKRKIVRST